MHTHLESLCEADDGRHVRSTVGEVIDGEVEAGQCGVDLRGEVGRGGGKQGLDATGRSTLGWARAAREVCTFSASAIAAPPSGPSLLLWSPSLVNALLTCAQRRWVEEGVNKSQTIR